MTLSRALLYYSLYPCIRQGHVICLVHAFDSLNAAKFCYHRRLRSFFVDESSNRVNVEPFCAMFPRIQYLYLPVDHVDSCRYIVDQLHDDLIKVIFCLPSTDDDEDQPGEPFSQ
jgi:hypothetical protein